MKPIVIDIHAHYIPKGLTARFEAHAASFSGVKLLRDATGNRLQFPDAEATRPMLPRVSDLAARRTWMDEARIDHQVLGLWTDAEGYELDAKQGLAWSRFINDCMWEELRDEPRFTPLASVPLQDGKLAADVLTEALDRGFAGAMIGNKLHLVSGMVTSAAAGAGQDMHLEVHTTSHDVFELPMSGTN